MFNILGSQKLIGIDLGTKSLKLVEVGKYKDSLILRNYIIVEIEAESKLAGFIETSQMFVETLGKLLADTLKNFRTNQTIFIASAPYAFAVYFPLPYIPLNSLKNAVRYEAKKYLPTTEEDYYFEWRNLEFQDIQKNTPNWFIFLSAVPLNLIEKFKKISDIARLKYQKTDIEYFTFEGYFKNRQGMNLVVNIGYGYSYAVVIWDGKTIFSSKLKFSLRQIIQNLASILQVDFEEAEKFFLNKGFKLLPEEEDLAVLYNSLISSLIAELEKIIIFLKETFDKNIDEIYFTGGITRADYFLELFSSKYQAIPIKILNPADFLYVDEKIKNQEKLPLLTTAIGSCINYLLS